MTREEAIKVIGLNKDRLSNSMRIAVETIMQEFSLTSDVEEAADNHICKVVDAAGHPGWDWDTQDIVDAFKAGAEWQKAKTPMPEDTVLFNKGVEEGQRLMLEDEDMGHKARI